MISQTLTVYNIKVCNVRIKPRTPLYVDNMAISLSVDVSYNLLFFFRYNCTLNNPIVTNFDQITKYFKSNLIWVLNQGNRGEIMT